MGGLEAREAFQGTAELGEYGVLAQVTAGRPFEIKRMRGGVHLLAVDQLRESSFSRRLAERLRLAVVSGANLAPDDVLTSWAIVDVGQAQATFGHLVVAHRRLTLRSDQAALVGAICEYFVGGLTRQTALPFGNDSQLPASVLASVDTQVHQHLLEEGGCRVPVGTTVQCGGIVMTLPRQLATRPKTEPSKTREAVTAYVDGIERTPRKLTLRQKNAAPVRTVIDVETQLYDLCTQLTSRQLVVAEIEHALNADGKKTSRLLAYHPVQQDLFSAKSD